MLASRATSFPRDTGFAYTRGGPYLSTGVPAAVVRRYMLTGGSNWGLTAADAVTTAYAPDTAVDWLLLRHEPRFSAFKVCALWGGRRDSPH